MVSMENILKFIVYGIMAYAALIALIFLFQKHLIYFPSKQKPNIAKASWAKEMHVLTKDKLVLHGWWSPPKDVSQPVIVYFHGNALNIENREPRGAFYHQKGVGLLFAEYRGFGGNEGIPSEAGLYDDARAYMDWILNDQKIPLSNIVIYGESLGTGVAVQMATEYRGVKAVVLETPFMSVLSMAQYRFPFIPSMDRLLRDHYRNDLKINDFDAPLLIGVAGKDLTVPNKFAEKLFEIRTKEKQIVRYVNAGHTELYVHGFGQDVLNFLNQN